MHRTVQLREWVEIPGQGIEARTDTQNIRVGSPSFVGIDAQQELAGKATVYVRINQEVSALHLQSFFRESIPQIIPRLSAVYDLSVLSGDNDKQRAVLADLFGKKSEMLFEQKPIDKLRYIEALQQKGRKVMMIGDGLNDAGALQMSNVGITLADDINNFTPSCDAILDAARLDRLPALMRLGRLSRRLINFSFIISIIYNIVGLSFAMRGLLRPVNAAILMPCSTITIVILSTGVSSLVARRLGLTLKVGEA
jgi:Cu+-exporting ATPase